jgi:limonene-1,2-epoxide hydrolase
MCLSRRPEYLLNDAHPTLESSVVDLLIALEEMDADAVRALVDPDIEWRNTGLPTVRGRKGVERILTIVSHLITRYEVVEVLTMSTDHDTVSSQREEIIRIGWFAVHLDVDGHCFTYRRLLRGLRFGPPART